MNVFVALIFTLATSRLTSGLGTTLVDGDVYVQVFAAIYSQLHENGTCSGIQTEAIENIEAIKWTFTKLNGGSYTNGVKIGVKVAETCRSVQKAKALTLNLIDEMRTGIQNNGYSDVIGVIGPDFSDEAGAISRQLNAMPDAYRLLQLGYATTSAFLTDRQSYGNFFRTIPPDDIQVMKETIESLDWTYIALVYENDAYGIGGKNALLEGITSQDVCFPVQIPFDTINGNLDDMENALRTQVIDANTPISGVLVFASSFLAQDVLKATENVLAGRPNASAPIFLFSEAAGYIEGHNINISRGAFLVTPPRRTITEFQTHWKSIFNDPNILFENIASNKWLRNVYDENFDCMLGNDKGTNTCPGITADALDAAIPSSIYNQYAIQACLVFATIVKVQNEKCGTSSQCSNSLLPNYIREKAVASMQDFSFDYFDSNVQPLSIDAFRTIVIHWVNGSGEVSYPGQLPKYEVYNMQMCGSRTCLVKVADYQSGNTVSITFENIMDYDLNGVETQWPNIRKPQCPDGHLCTTCLKASGSDDHTTLYVPGDLYIVGIVPVHNVGPTPLKCDGIKLGGLDIVESIRFAVDTAKDDFGTKVPTANIGVIIIDSCNDPQIVQEKMLTLQRFGVFKDDSYIPVADKIIGYVGGWSSDVSIAVAEITTRLGFPQVSFGSTASVLSSNSLYPYFLRVPSSDDHQASTMIDIVEALESNYIQIVYSDTAYGRGGLDVLLRLVEEKTICVAQTVQLTQQSIPADIVASLRNYKEASIVVMFVGSFEVEQLVPYMNDNIAQGEFLLIASEGWGTRISVDGFTNMIGTITLASELPNNNQFTSYLKTLQSDGSNLNPWIRPYMENYFNCYYQWSYNKTLRDACTGDERLDVIGINYRVDAWTTFAERAVYALLQGAKSALDEYCGQSQTICDNLRNNTSGFVELLTKERLTNENSFLSRVFDDNGDGLAGYKIFAISLSLNGEYESIGFSVPGGGGFTFNKPTFESIRGSAEVSSCGACQQCFPVASTAESSTPVGIIALSVVLAVICVILVVVLVCMCRKHGCCIKMENGKLKLVNPYLTPTYAETKDVSSAGSRRLPPRPTSDNYDQIKESGGSASQGSWARQPPNSGGENFSNQSMNNSNRGDSGMHSNTQSASNQGSFQQQRDPNYSYSTASNHDNQRNQGSASNMQELQRSYSKESNTSHNSYLIPLEAPPKPEPEAQGSGGSLGNNNYLSLSDSASGTASLQVENQHVAFRADNESVRPVPVKRSSSKTVVTDDVQVSVDQSVYSHTEPNSDGYDHTNPGYLHAI